MSIEAINWVLNEAPRLPAHAFGVLLGLANHAGPTGLGAYASQATLAAYARKTDRAVRNDIKELIALGLIVVSPNQGPAAHIPADVRPVVYDLRLDQKMPTPGSPLPDAGGSTVPDAPGSPLPARKPTTGSGVPHARKPTSDKPSTNQTKKKTSSSSTATTRGTRIPDDFAVTVAMTAWGQEKFPGFDGHAETDNFIDYWRGRAGAAALKVDWEATWRTWIRRAAKDAASPGPSARSPGPRANSHTPYQNRTDPNAYEHGDL